LSAVGGPRLIESEEDVEHDSHDGTMGLGIAISVARILRRSHRLQRHKRQAHHSLTSARSRVGQVRPSCVSSGSQAACPQAHRTTIAAGAVSGIEDRISIRPMRLPASASQMSPQNALDGRAGHRQIEYWHVVIGVWSRLDRPRYRSFSLRDPEMNGALRYKFPPERSKLHSGTRGMWSVVTRRTHWSAHRLHNAAGATGQ
jgi:hypothetical protein